MTDAEFRVFQMVAKSLERIADTLDRITEKFGGSGMQETPFPWGDSRIPVRLRNPNRWKIKRPETFEQFIRLGRSTLHDGNARGVSRYIGKASIGKLDPIFEERGFGELWMKS